ncbi:MAG TPA: hypothetical protein VF167_09130 [Longimicrobiaceae bacterium]
MRRAVRGRSAALLNILAVALAALFAGEASAQLPLEAWVRPLAAVPVGAFAGRDDGIEAGASFGFDAGASIDVGALTLYGEYQEIGFSCGECEEVEVEETALDRGWGAGVIVPHPSTIAGLRPWARAGIIVHHLRFRFGDERAYSDPSLGWSLGVGAEARPLPWLRLEPSLLFNRYSAEYGFAIDVPDRRTSISYITLGLGVGVGL